MLQKTLSFIHRNATGRNVLILLVCYIFFIAYVMPQTEKALNAHSLSPTGPFDLFFSYSPAQAYDMLDKFGPEGRPYYARIEYTVDLIYPICYTLFFSFLISFLFTKAFPDRPALKNLAASAFLLFGLDMCENIGIISMNFQYPGKFDTLVYITSLFTSLKWGMVFFVNALALIGLVTAIYRYFRK